MTIMTKTTASAAVAALTGVALMVSATTTPAAAGNHAAAAALGGFAVGTIFGQHGVNIAQMAVGRAGDQPGGSAVGVLNLDGEPSAAALEAMLALPAITAATVIRLPKPGVRPAWMGA